MEVASWIYVNNGSGRGKLQSLSLLQESAYSGPIKSRILESYGEYREWKSHRENVNEKSKIKRSIIWTLKTKPNQL